MISERDYFNIYQVQLRIKEIWNSETSNQLAAKYDASWVWCRITQLRTLSVYVSFQYIKFRWSTCKNEEYLINTYSLCERTLTRCQTPWCILAHINVPWRLYTQNLPKKYHNTVEMQIKYYSATKYTYTYTWWCLVVPCCCYLRLRLIRLLLHK